MLRRCNCPQHSTASTSGVIDPVLLPFRVVPPCNLSTASQARLLSRRASAASADNGAIGPDARDIGRLEMKQVNSRFGFASLEEEDFCIIETSETVKDFEALRGEDIDSHIQARRNQIFLLMEEVRRLRIQQRVKGVEVTPEDELAKEVYKSALPFLPTLSEKTLNTYYTFYGAFFAALIAFGGIASPVLEVKLGLGGLSYHDFVVAMHLPEQLAQVDPIVASFTGGAVGVLSALLVVEVNNVKKQQKYRCLYCEGTGYLTCGHCVGRGTDPDNGGVCIFCAGTSKVMCTSCLCTGKQLATEHDPRASPF